MILAGRLLRQTGLSLGEVADAVGCTVEFAFAKRSNANKARASRAPASSVRRLTINQRQPRLETVRVQLIDLSARLTVVTRAAMGRKSWERSFQKASKQREERKKASYAF